MVLAVLTVTLEQAPASTKPTDDTQTRSIPTACPQISKGSLLISGFSNATILLPSLMFPQWRGLGEGTMCRKARKWFRTVRLFLTEIKILIVEIFLLVHAVRSLFFSKR